MLRFAGQIRVNNGLSRLSQSVRVSTIRIIQFLRDGVGSDMAPTWKDDKMSDATLKQSVLDELEWDPGVIATEIGVTAKDGVITLSGFVGGYNDKWVAERAVQRVAGVKAIAEELKVRLFDYNAMDDDMIAKRAVQSIEWDSSIPKDHIMIKVEKGWVSLTGSVEWNFQRSNAEADIRKLHGVMGVSNSITVKPAQNNLAKSADIRTRIHAAFARSGELDADGVKVTSDGGHVALRGEVKTWHERQTAQTAAWSAPGVTKVDNLLTVS